MKIKIYEYVAGLIFFVLLPADLCYMSEMRDYIILPLCNLEKRKYTLDFRLNTEFFSDFRNSEIIEGSVEISLDVEKFSRFMNVVLTFAGILTVSCDRCLENLDIPVEGKNMISVVFGDIPENPDEENPNEDIIHVNGEDENIDLTVYVYESICLAMPIQRVHGNDKNGKSLCNPGMLKYITNRINDF